MGTAVLAGWLAGAGSAAGQETPSPEPGPAAADSARVRADFEAKQGYTPPEDGYPSPGWQAVKSMILPGWGQASNGAWLKAPLFTGAYAGFIAWGVNINQDVQDAKGLLNANRGTADESFYENEVDRLTRSRDAKYWFAGLTLVVSMADAFVDASLKDFDKRIDAEVAAVPGTGVSLGVTVGWDPGAEARTEGGR